MNTQLAKRKVLQKVRRHFLHKTPEDEEDNEVVNVPQQVDENPTRLISTSIGIVERNRKICVGVRFLSNLTTVSNVKIEKGPACRAVTFSVKLNEDIPTLPWDYMVKRLESFGDLNLATWARKLQNHRKTYARIMAQCADQTEQDLMLSKNVREIKNQVALAHREIESSYPYKCVKLFSNGIATVPVCATYSEGFLKEMDHSPEGFVDWVSENGLPKLFGGECPIHQDIARAFLDCSVFQGNPVKYGSEYSTYFYDKHNVRKRAVLKVVLTAEPAPGGMFFTGYAILKSKNTVASTNEELGSEILKNCKEKADLNLEDLGPENVIDEPQIENDEQ